jgi:hypothetical protein
MNASKAAIKVAGTSGFYAFIGSLSTCNLTSSLMLLFFVFPSSSIYPAVEGCGNCGKVGGSLPSFPSAVGTVENMRFVFHGFHGAAVSTTYAGASSVLVRQLRGPNFSTCP